MRSPDKTATAEAGHRPTSVVPSGPGPNRRSTTPRAPAPQFGSCPPVRLLSPGSAPAPRFGSCHLRLRPAVLTRATFCALRHVLVRYGQPHGNLNFTHRAGLDADSR
ncbi:DUF3626 domain-containing protein [Micromonospora foliorum]|uniref:DUF3626 domain-containing protein n=1 Tax=Micromonospora foliorum TaxID=2911210 RepID=UPI001EE90A0C|nr:DUF3626 domain-containing protein [Micromonospora foliorum]MCG5436464.1 DUF3626 domain-containing protein [Micromonospora foliorum]